MSARTVMALAANLVLLAACDFPPRISNTGYEGTWARGTERSTSTIAIVRDGEHYRFRWAVDSPGGRWTVRCDWDGSCEEFVDGAKTSEYTFRTWEDGKTGHIMLECAGRVFKPNELDVHYVDELVLEAEGLSLWSYTLERSGQRFEGDARPKRRFDKVSDAVADRPTSGVGRAGTP